MKFSKSLLSLVVVLAATGCSGIHDAYEKQANALHSELSACEAWGRWSWCYDELAHPKHFARGFKAGYQDILNGGKGCQPTLPPREYWSASYRNAEGHCCVNAWFDGFSHGVLAAHEDGAATYGNIPLSPTARANFATAQQPAPEYDWSNAPSAAAPAPPADTYRMSVPPSQPPVLGPAEPPIDVPEAPRTYEDDAKPLPEKPLETTSTGRVNLPNLGG